MCFSFDIKGKTIYWCHSLKRENKFQRLWCPSWSRWPMAWTWAVSHFESALSFKQSLNESIIWATHVLHICSKINRSLSKQEYEFALLCRDREWVTLWHVSCVITRQMWFIFDSPVLTIRADKQWIWRFYNQPINVSVSFSFILSFSPSSLNGCNWPDLKWWVCANPASAPNTTAARRMTGLQTRTLKCSLSRAPLTLSSSPQRL